MGIPHFNSSNVALNKQPPNPATFKIIHIKECGNYCVVLVNYPDCINYNGNKLLITRNISGENLTKLKYLDPHFVEFSELEIVARFLPTEEGIQSAFNFIETLSVKSKENL